MDKIIQETLNSWLENRVILHDKGDRDQPVGKHQDAPDSDFNGVELQMGIDIEKEHTDDPVVAKEIAKDHLAEIPDYYTRLKKMEDEAKVGR